MCWTLLLRVGGWPNYIIIVLRVSGHFEQFDVLSENRNKGWDIWVMKLRPPSLCWDNVPSLAGFWFWKLPLIDLTVSFWKFAFPVNPFCYVLILSFYFKSGTGLSRADAPFLLVSSSYWDKHFNYWRITIAARRGVQAVSALRLGFDSVVFLRLFVIHPTDVLLARTRCLASSWPPTRCLSVYSCVSPRTCS